MDNNSPDLGPKSPEPDSTIPVKVLIVEDDPSFKLMISAVFENDPYITFAVCTKGEKALELLRVAKKEKTPFDLVISDLGLPGMNGFELARVVREELLAGRFTLFTGSDVLSNNTREQLVEKGIDNVLKKPDLVVPFLNEIRQTRILKQGQSENPQT